ncbi:hypothetical protein B5S33_g5373 [[Candida] boidinii]|nr:hypothetical protein B5S33_g5373 [[Candida] boidinii]
MQKIEKRSLTNDEPSDEPVPIVKRQKFTQDEENAHTLSSTQSDKIGNASHTLYVRNLDDKIPILKMKQNLYILFSTYGDVVQINYTNRGSLRGQAWVVFSSVKEASVALSNVLKYNFFGKSIDISYANKESSIVERPTTTSAGYLV